MMIVLETVLDMVMNEFALGVADGFFHRVELLSEVNTRPTGFDHRDDGSDMSFSAPEALGDRWMRFVLHGTILSWGIG